MIALALFFLWIIFNGKLTWELVAFGAVISVSLAWFVQRFITPGFTLRSQWNIAGQIPGYASYFWFLIKEIVIANITVMRMILTDREVVVPKLAVFQTKLRTKAAKVVLADCITLTPGTITVHLQGDEYLVHCLDECLEEGLLNSEFEKRLLSMETDWEKAAKP